MRIEPDARAEPRGRDDAAAAGRGLRPHPHRRSRAPTARSGSRRRTGATTASSGSRPPRPCRCVAAGTLVSAGGRHRSCAPGPRSPPSSAAPTTGSTCGAAPNDGTSWAGYTSAGITSTNAPSAASSAPGRVDLVTRRSSGAVVQTWFRGGRRLGLDPARRSSSSRSTPSPWATAPSTCSPWRRPASGSAALGPPAVERLASPSAAGSRRGCRRRPTRARGRIVVSGRGTDGATYEREFTPTAGLDTWRGKR